MRRMKEAFIVLCCAGALISCKKTDNREKETELNPSTHLISSARAFFDKKLMNGEVKFNGTTNERQVINKMPDWSRAYEKTTSKGEFVIVPVMFDKNLVGSIKGLQEGRFTLQNQTALYIYKDERGDFVADLVYWLPDKEYLSGKSDVFSGAMLIEDWEGNYKSSYLIKEGKYYKAKNAGSKSTYMDPQYDCWWLDTYICSTNSLGYYDCELVYSIMLFCEGDDEGGGNPHGDDHLSCQVPNLNEILANGQTTSISTGYAGPELANVAGDQARKFYIDWEFYKNDYLFFSWKFISHLAGDQVKKEGDTDWSWINFGQWMMTLEGSTPFTTGCSLSSAIGTVESGGAAALMRLEFNIFMNFQCLLGSGIIPFTKHHSTQKAWDVHGNAI